MAKTLMYQFYPILKTKEYPVWEEDDPLKPFYQWGVWEMQGQLPRLKEMGVDIVWLSGCMKSPRFDHGYDVEDYYSVEPYFAALYELENFIYEAHKLGIKVLLDLVLNHTSTKCRWFKDRPDWYWWSKEPKTGWKNLFDGGPAWKYDEDRGMYYLHLFHPEQADLKWFRNGKINEELVTEFRRIVDHWKREGIDGFRLDVPQSINKNPNVDELNFERLIDCNSKAIEVINQVFEGKKCTLAMEMFDPTQDGAIMREYLNKTNINYIMNVKLKDSPEPEVMAKAYSEFDAFMLDIESHDSMRFLSRPGMTPDKELNTLFWTDAENICIYQGQELGLKNPELTDEQILALDAQTAMQYGLGAPINHLTTRANARVPFPEDELKRQQEDENSFLRRFEAEARLWKKLP